MQWVLGYIQVDGHWLIVALDQVLSVAYRRERWKASVHVRGKSERWRHSLLYSSLKRSFCSCVCVKLTCTKPWTKAYLSEETWRCKDNGSIQMSHFTWLEYTKISSFLQGAVPSMNICSKWFQWWWKDNQRYYLFSDYSVATWRCLRVVATWRCLRVVATWRCLRVVTTWRCLRVVATWRYLRVVTTWRCLRVVATWRCLRVVATWRCLRVVATWRYLRVVATWRCLRVAQEQVKILHWHLVLKTTKDSSGYYKSCPLATFLKTNQLEF